MNAKRSQGINDEQIAWSLNLSPSQVQAIPYPKPNHNRSRAVQAMQLQVMAQQLVPAIEKGDRDAMLTLLKVQKREADLLGLDAPKEQVIHNFNNENLANIDDPKALPTSELRRRLMESITRGEVVDVTPEPTESAESPPPDQP